MALPVTSTERFGGSGGAFGTAPGYLWKLVETSAMLAGSFPCRLESFAGYVEGLATHVEGLAKHV